MCLFLFKTGIIIWQPVVALRTDDSLTENTTRTLHFKVLIIAVVNYLHDYLIIQCVIIITLHNYVII